jgi:hypothetical protein
MKKWRIEWDSLIRHNLKKVAEPLVKSGYGSYLLNLKELNI